MASYRKTRVICRNHRTLSLLYIACDCCASISHAQCRQPGALACSKPSAPSVLLPSLSQCDSYLGRDLAYPGHVVRERMRRASAAARLARAWRFSASRWVGRSRAPPAGFNRPVHVHAQLKPSCPHAVAEDDQKAWPCFTLLRIARDSYMSSFRGHASLCRRPVSSDPPPCGFQVTRAASGCPILLPVHGLCVVHGQLVMAGLSPVPSHSGIMVTAQGCSRHHAVGERVPFPVPVAYPASGPWPQC